MDAFNSCIDASLFRSFRYVSSLLAQKVHVPRPQLSNTRVNPSNSAILVLLYFADFFGHAATRYAYHELVFAQRNGLAEGVHDRDKTSCPFATPSERRHKFRPGCSSKVPDTLALLHCSQGFLQEPSASKFSIRYTWNRLVGTTRRGCPQPQARAPSHAYPAPATRCSEEPHLQTSTSSSPVVMKST